MEFTAEKYKQMTGFPVPRFDLLTRHKDDSSDDNLMKATSEENAASPLISPSYGEYNQLIGTSTEHLQDFQASPSTSPYFGVNDGLIGTSAECQKNIEDQEKAVEASLKQAKEDTHAKKREKQTLIPK